MIGNSPRVLIKKNSKMSDEWKKTKIQINWYGKELPIGTEYKAFETDNFGYVFLKEEFNYHRLWKE